MHCYPLLQLSCVIPYKFVCYPIEIVLQHMHYDTCYHIILQYFSVKQLYNILKSVIFVYSYYRKAWKRLTISVKAHKIN